jgi:hypothetical protein
MQEQVQMLAQATCPQPRIPGLAWHRPSIPTGRFGVSTPIPPLNTLSFTSMSHGTGDRGPLLA